MFTSDAAVIIISLATTRCNVYMFMFMFMLTAIEGIASDAKLCQLDTCYAATLVGLTRQYVQCECA